MHTTNYINTFIETAEDCPAIEGQIPPAAEGSPSVARIQYDLLADNPYRYTSDDVVFQSYALKHGIAPDEQEAARAAFFAKAQPCLRASPLAKRYGWGIHHDENGRTAIYAINSKEYRALAGDSGIARKKAMRSKKA